MEEMDGTCSPSVSSDMEMLNFIGQACDNQYQIVLLGVNLHKNPFQDFFVKSRLIVRISLIVYIEQNLHTTSAVWNILSLTFFVQGNSVPDSLFGQIIGHESHSCNHDKIMLENNFAILVSNKKNDIIWNYGFTVMVNTLQMVICSVIFLYSMSIKLSIWMRWNVNQILSFDLEHFIVQLKLMRLKIIWIYFVLTIIYRERLFWG